MIGSWWKRATVLLGMILLSALLFFVWTSFNVTGQIRRTVEEENRNSIRLWAGDVESRAGAIYEHIHELLVTLHNSNELRTGTPIMNARTKKKILDMMEEKLIVSPGAGSSSASAPAGPGSPTCWAGSPTGTNSICATAGGRRRTCSRCTAAGWRPAWRMCSR